MAVTAAREAVLERFFRQRVRVLGGHSIKLAPTEAGVPDRLVMMPGGRMFLVELKGDHGSLRPAQVEWHRRAANLGVHVDVLQGKDEVLAWLARITDEYYQELEDLRRRALED